jgi:uncharacterized phage protein gp47/JayE
MALPIPNLDDKTFEQLVEEARARIPRYAPNWTDHNLHDPGITFLELFAWLAEMQIYSLNRVTDRHKLKFLGLVGRRPEAAKSAKVQVSFSIPMSQNPLLVGKGTQVAAVDTATGEDIIFETDEDIRVSLVVLKEILTYEQSGFIVNTDANDQDGLFYYAFGEEPVKDNALYLGFEYDGDFPGNDIKMRVNLYEQDLPQKPAQPCPDFEILPSAELTWEYWSQNNKWKRLNIKDDKTFALAQSGQITFLGPEDGGKKKLYTLEEELFWVRCKINMSEYEIPPRIDSILLNTVSATHGKTWGKDVPEILGSSDGLPNQVFTLDHIPVIAGSHEIEVQEPDGRWQQWLEIADFDASTPEDLHYTINHATGEVTFGDGIRGRIPPKGENNIRVGSYRSGGGETGNVKANSIDRILNPELSLVTVINKTAATGGEEAESLEEAIKKAKKDLRTGYRAVTSEDYEKLALATPGVRVARAKALPLYHPCYSCVTIPTSTGSCADDTLSDTYNSLSLGGEGQGEGECAYVHPYPKIPGVVTVVLIPHVLKENRVEKPMPGINFRRMVYNHLDKSRLLTTNLFVIAPEYVQVSVKATVNIKPKSDSKRVEREIEEELKTFLSPLRGGPEGGGWPFGRDVMKSEVYQVINNVSGVDCVSSLSLRREAGCAEMVCDNIRIPPHALVYSGEHEISTANLSNYKDYT